MLAKGSGDTSSNLKHIRRMKEEWKIIKIGRGEYEWLEEYEKWLFNEDLMQSLETLDDSVWGSDITVVKESSSRWLKRGDDKLGGSWDSFLLSQGSDYKEEDAH